MRMAAGQLGTREGKADGKTHISACSPVPWGQSGRVVRHAPHRASAVQRIAEMGAEVGTPRSAVREGVRT